MNKQEYLIKQKEEINRLKYEIAEEEEIRRKKDEIEGLKRELWRFKHPFLASFKRKKEYD